MTSYGREKPIKLVCSDVNVQNQATLEVTLASVRIDVDVASSLVLVVVSSVEMSIRVHRTPLCVRYFLGLLANELDPICDVSTYELRTLFWKRTLSWLVNE